MLLVILGGLGSGKLQYGFAYMKCGGAPIDASRFMASYSYNLPTDKMYNPGIFSEYFCTESEAQKKGFHHSVLSDAAQKESVALEVQREEEARFSPDKVSYTLYVPIEKYTYGQIRIMKMSNKDPHSFYSVKQDGYNVANVREGAIPSNYQLCTNEISGCTSIGKDKRGLEIMKQTSDSKSSSVGYTANIGGTFINLTDIYDEITDTDILNIYSSLGEYENAE